MSKDELLDLVSPKDKVIGTIVREEAYAMALHNFRVVNAFIINSKGKLWIPKRHPSKKIAPFALDCSVGGHVLSRESYFQAFVREAQEETFVNPLEKRWKILAKLNPYDHKCSAFMVVYEIFSEDSICYNPNDFVGGEWMYPSELRELLQQNTPAKTDLSIILKHSYDV